MILGKIWRAFMAKLNVFANWVRGLNPVEQMQYELDRATEQLKSGRQGLERQRGLVERVTTQVSNGDNHIAKLGVEIASYLKTGNRDIAGRLALELQTAKTQLNENKEQLKLHDESYRNNLLKLKHATGKLGEVRNRIAKQDAELKMSRTEAEIAKLAQSLNFDVTTDFGQLEQVMQDRIDENRAVVRVAADISGHGIEEIQHDENVAKAQAEEALKQFEASTT